MKKIILSTSVFLLFFPIFWQNQASASWFDDLTCGVAGTCALQEQASKQLEDAVQSFCEVCKQQNKQCVIGRKFDSYFGVPFPQLDMKCEDLPPSVKEPTELETLKADINAKKPVLEVNIPGINFSDVKSAKDSTGTYLYLAWLPEFISGIYKFGIAIVSIVAAVIIIIQGLRVITSAGGEAKNEAYKKIFQSIVGLFIAWGSYAILYTINPALVQFNALKVKVVEPIDIAEHMQTALGTAEVGSNSGGSGGGGGSAPTAAPFVGAYTPKFTTCPIALDTAYDAKSLNPNSDRAKEFYTKIVASSQITGAIGSAERVLQIADAAIACNVGLGSCGRTVGQIYNLAGINYRVSGCLTTANGCEPWEKENRYLAPAIIHNKKITQPDGPATSFKDVVDIIKAAAPAGWPDAWATELQPGDAIWFYNGNGSGGNHTAMFVGWKGGSYEASGGWAETINGGMLNRLTGRAYWCITTKCGDYLMPIIKTVRPTQSGR